MNNHSNQRMLSLVPLLLFFVLAVCILYVSVMGINISQNIAERDSANYALRTACQYTSVRIQKAASSKDVAIQEFDGCDALVINETINGEEYLTRIYCHDGYLRELFTKANTAFAPSDGEKLLRLKDMSASSENGILTIEFTENGGSSKTLLLGEVAK